MNIEKLAKRIIWKSISFVVGGKETAPEIVSAREVSSRAPLCAANVQESSASIGIFRIPRMNVIPRSMSKSNFKEPQPQRIAQIEGDFNERYLTLPFYLCV
ncbi:hypothetical protein AVEN_119181-1 [Araneus ventricosus]|uniref:Uncharacterized protein n=1 Tax=Araneus ventricosus TaxID=182803 RepID=A0A4Y2S8T9_ARAVE|nr:hypothetical protein AVEN_119181-1 [Araneus ventricosus]